jgi:hypothetical protein
VLWVAQSGGDFKLVSAALASIVDNSSTNRYLIKVAPGTYVEPDGIDLKDYIDIEGAGPHLTTLTADSSATGHATVRADGAGSTEIRGFAVENVDMTTGSTHYGLAFTNSTGGVRVSDLAIHAQGPIASNGIGVSLTSSYVTLSDVSIAVETGNAVGVLVAASSPTLRNVRVFAFANGSPGDKAIGFESTGNSAPNVDGLTVDAMEAAPSVEDHAIVLLGTTSAQMSNVKASSSTYGAIQVNSAGTTTFTNLAATSSSGPPLLAVSQGTVIVRDSSLSASVSVDVAGGTVHFVNTQITGSITGAPTCLNVFDADYVARSC